jgi:hypothetical protein
MSVSANTLFHFTLKKEDLLNILKNGFYPRYCIEDVKLSFEERYQKLAHAEIAIPMVSFCDIPLSQIRSHILRFGPYAVGMAVEWGIKNGLNPLMYVAPESNPIKIFRDSISDSISYLLDQNNGKNPEGKKLGELAEHIMYLIRYLKPYEGKKWDGKEFNGELMKFYDEREWRYIPDFYEMKKRYVEPVLEKSQYLDKNKMKEYNRILTENFKLDFTPRDIRYIIVEKEEEVQNMICEIEHIKRNYPIEEQKLLLTKLISIDRLNEDF